MKLIYRTYLYLNREGRVFVRMRSPRSFCGPTLVVFNECRWYTPSSRVRYMAVPSSTLSSHRFRCRPSAFRHAPRNIIPASGAPSQIASF